MYCPISRSYIRRGLIPKNSANLSPPLENHSSESDWNYLNAGKRE